MNERLNVVKNEIKTKLNVKRLKRTKVYPLPRYDSVFEYGLAWLIEGENDGQGTRKV